MFHVPRSMIRKAIIGCGMTCAILAGVGCAHVKPQERGKLAHPSMTTSDLAGPGEEHVRAIQEGSTGGNVAVGGGCGCN